MSKFILSRISNLLLILVVGVVASAPVFGNANITIQNNDGGSTGFNDPTPASPVGGNSGTTVGQQRLNAFMFAASIWGATINSSQTIVIGASWQALTPCTATSGVLGSAGTVGIQRDFPNAPFASTWYSTALANSLSNTDRNGSSPEINAQFNINVGTPGCLASSPWYYGLDGNHGNGIDLVSVLLHEFGHGLGFQTFTSSSTGAPNSGFFSIYDHFLRDNSTNKLWIDMTNAERVASAINSGNLVWAGPQVVADVPNVLGTPRLRINSPPGIAGNYTIGTAEFGPRISSTITANVVRALDLADVDGPTTTDGCSAFTNAAAISGNIAFIDRGTCNFTVKVKNAQNAGAVGVVIGNVPSSVNPTIPPGMAGSDATITIPSASLAVGDADTIRAQLGGSVNGSILLDHSVFSGADSSDRPLMFAPNPLEQGSSVSHFDTSLFPNQLMEPDNSRDLTHNVTPPFDLTFSLFRDLGWTGGSSPLPSIQLSSSTTSAAESVGSISIIVTRTGDTSGVSTVEYATSDTAGNNACANVTGAASSRCDYIRTLGTFTFAAGETSKTILVPLVDDSFAEGAETFTITLSNVIGATLGTSTATITINDNDGSTGANPIDQNDFFVRQNYIDFLNREPDTNGFNFWKNQLDSCGANAACLEVKRINVSAAFFLSIEFQETGYLVYRIYKAAFSNLTNPPGAPVPIGLNDFLRDTQRIGQGVQVNVGNWEAQLEANKQAYVLDFVRRSDFMAQYPSTMSASDFVLQLNTRAGGVLSPAEQTSLINILGSTPEDASKRALVLRAVAEDADLKSAESNKAFVLMQYFGYLRRNPNDFPDADFAGFNFWLQKMIQFNGNFIQAEMVKAFISSEEYRRRFGPIP